jgi:hypothetical protein
VHDVQVSGSNPDGLTNFFERIYREMRRREKASDHAPAWIELGDVSATVKQRRSHRRAV